MCEPRIYVADLAAYNNGILHGVWIDATTELENIQEEVNKMLRSSPEQDAEEYAIHDYEGFGDFYLGEYAGLDTAHKVACFIEEFPDFAAALLAEYGGDLDEARKAAQENYIGCYAYLSDFVEILTEETTEIPQSLVHYIDYERMAADMEMNGDIFSIRTGSTEVHVFWSR